MYLTILFELKMPVMWTVDGLDSTWTHALSIVFPVSNVSISRSICCSCVRTFETLLTQCQLPGDAGYKLRVCAKMSHDDDRRLSTAVNMHGRRTFLGIPTTM